MTDADLTERLRAASETTLSALPTGGPPDWMRALLREAADALEDERRWRHHAEAELQRRYDFDAKVAAFEARNPRMLRIVSFHIAKLI